MRIVSPAVWLLSGKDTNWNFPNETCTLRQLATAVFQNATASSIGFTNAEAIGTSHLNFQVETAPKPGNYCTILSVRLRPLSVVRPTANSASWIEYGSSKSFFTLDPQFKNHEKSIKYRKLKNTSLPLLVLLGYQVFFKGIRIDEKSTG